MHMYKMAVVFGAALLLAGCNVQKANGNETNQITPPPRKPPGKGTNQQVDLIWKQGTSSWMVKLNNGQEQDPAEATTMLEKDVGPTMFVVDISGAATFKDPGGLDVWEGVNEKTNPQSGINTTQVLEPIVTKNGKRLVFFDLNYGDKVTLNYRLNFNNNVPSVDPIIDNGGGNWP